MISEETASVWLQEFNKQKDGMSYLLGLQAKIMVEEPIMTAMVVNTCSPFTGGSMASLYALAIQHELTRRQKEADDLKKPYQK